MIPLKDIFEKGAVSYQRNWSHLLFTLSCLQNIEKENVKIVFVNSKIVGIDAVLSNGDKIALAPATGGM